MEILEDPSFKNKYQKSKLRVKRWENDFKEKYGRKPSKEDIRAADAVIRDSYKMYYNLKTKALEQSLLDITFTDESQANVSANTSCDTTLMLDSLEDTSYLDKTLPESPIKNSENVDPDKTEKKLHTEEEDANIEGAWGSHLNKKNELSGPRKSSLSLVRSSSFQLSRNLFSSSNLTKRNPRKSLSSSKLKSSKSDLSLGGETTFEVEKETTDGFDVNKSLFGKTPKVLQGKIKIPTHATNAIQQLIEGKTSIERSINPAWLDRCTKDNIFEPVTYNPQRLSGTSDSGVESMDTSDLPNHETVSTNVQPPLTKNEDHFTDSEDFIANSDSEDERRNKRIRNFKKTLLGVEEERSVKRLCVSEPKISPDDCHQASFEPVNKSSDFKPEKEKETYEKIVASTVEPEEEELDEEPVRKINKRAKKPTKKAATKKKEGASATRRSSARKKSSKEEPVANEDLDSSEEFNSPIYSVETTQVVPRFPVPEEETTDLVSSFSRSILGETFSEEAAGVSKPKQLTAQEKLQKKIASGAVNENFVRINIKKKVFVRGKRGINASRYRKNQWKQRKKELASGEGSLDLADLAEKSGGACFKCGETGHFAQRCPNTKSQDLLPKEEDDEEEESKFLSLEEAEKLVAESKRPQGKLVSHKIPEELLARLLPPVNGAIEPIYPTLPDGSLLETPEEVFHTLRMFGHEKFRTGQEKAVMRILSGKSSLVTLATGSGKSLCYQLPAYLYSKRSRCITLVVSPLVSLMDDQVTGIPKFLSAGALHTGQSAKVKDQIMDNIREGKLDILFLSPEAVVAGEKSTGFGALLRQLPPIAFACIDEVHCISQWSHNFRPSYLMICRVLVEKLGVKTILGLTATATTATAENIVQHLKIPDGMSGRISDVPMPRNLTLTVSKDEYRDRALVDLIRSERFLNANSIIVYCTRREECARIAGLLRVSLQDQRDTEVGGKCSVYAEAYHAGLSATRRKLVQKSFMSGETRVVVATVAFGMGINKADIRSVIHYNMPANFESYVQEVGRAGRDGLPAHCHLFLSPSTDADKLELRRHIFANGVDRHTIRRLLQKIFVPCSCGRLEEGTSGKRCQGHEVAIPIDETVRTLDVTAEIISTLLCYLELHPKRFITVLSSVYVTAKVSSYGGPEALKKAAQTCAPLAMAVVLDAKKVNTQSEKSTVLEFNVIEVAAAIGWDSGVVKRYLKDLEWQTVNGKPKRSVISVNFETLGLRVRAPGDLSDVELDEALEDLAARAQSQETSGLRQLDTIYAALEKFSLKSIKQCEKIDDDLMSRSESLKQVIREYFNSDVPPLEPLLAIEDITVKNESEIVGDIRSLISSYRDTNFTGRAVARIFHGIQSPNYPALTWGRCRFWRLHLSTDFHFICRAATREILAIR